MIFKYSLAVLLFIGFYILGMILSGKFYEWAYESETVFFEVNEKEMRFMFSVFWFVSIPIYFAFLLIFVVYQVLELVYKKFV